MQRLQDEPAYVLHRRQYSESSLLLELLTQSCGRIGVLARATRGPRSTLAALLQPFQALCVDLAGRGELLRLVRAEATAAALPLRAESALAGMYFNELLVRSCGRSDPQPALFAAYTHALTELVGAATPALTVRRFERDLLQCLGYGMDFERDEQGAMLVTDGLYALAPERGFHAVADGPGYSGAALLALDADAEPEARHLRELRGLFRQLISNHLGGELPRSWALLAGLRGLSFGADTQAHEHSGQSVSKSS